MGDNFNFFKLLTNAFLSVSKFVPIEPNADAERARPPVPKADILMNDLLEVPISYVFWILTHVIAANSDTKLGYQEVCFNDISHEYIKNDVT